MSIRSAIAGQADMPALTRTRHVGVEPGSNQRQLGQRAPPYILPLDARPRLNASSELTAVRCRGYSVEAVGHPGHASLTVDIGLQQVVDVQLVEQWRLFVG